MISCIRFAIHRRNCLMKRSLRASQKPAFAEKGISGLGKEYTFQYVSGK